MATRYPKRIKPVPAGGTAPKRNFFGTLSASKDNGKTQKTQKGKGKAKDTLAS